MNCGAKYKKHDILAMNVEKLICFL